jgi:hypothetical protein
LLCVVGILLLNLGRCRVTGLRHDLRTALRRAAPQLTR